MTKDNLNGNINANKNTILPNNNSSNNGSPFIEKAQFPEYVNGFTADNNETDPVVIHTSRQLLDDNSTNSPTASPSWNLTESPTLSPTQTPTSPTTPQPTQRPTTELQHSLLKECFEYVGNLNISETDKTLFNNVVEDLFQKLTVTQLAVVIKALNPNSTPQDREAAAGIIINNINNPESFVNQTNPTQIPFNQTIINLLENAASTKAMSLVNHCFIGLRSPTDSKAPTPSSDDDSWILATKIGAGAGALLFLAAISVVYIKERNKVTTFNQLVQNNELKAAVEFIVDHPTVMIECVKKGNFNSDNHRFTFVSMLLENENLKKDERVEIVTTMIKKYPNADVEFFAKEPVKKVEIELGDMRSHAERKSDSGDEKSERKYSVSESPRSSVLLPSVDNKGPKVEASQR